MAFINGAEWIIIILIVVILFFGAKKIPELARSLGKASSEFQRARVDAKKTLETDRYSSSTSKSLDREKLESIAETLGVDYSNKNDQDLRQAIESELKKQNTE